jgi:CelD/BcsL family acetyltransferase involved in cellulose biosynthesis
MDAQQTAHRGYTVTLQRDTGALARLGPEWNRLLARSTTRSPFLAFGWMEAWWESREQRPGRSQPYILVARTQAGEACGILPLYRRAPAIPGSGPTILRLMGIGAACPEHLDAIVDAEDAAEIIAAMLDRLAAERTAWDVLDLTDLAEDAAILPALAAWGARHHFDVRTRQLEECPYVAIDGDYAPYICSLSASHRRKLRVHGQRLEDQYRVELEVASEPAAASAALEELFRLHALRWTAKHERSRFDSERLRAFHRRVVPTLAADDAVRMFLLRCDGRAVAAGYTFCQDEVMYAYQVGFDPAFASLNVGRLLFGRMLEYCFEHGIRRFDFLRGRERYKGDWTDLSHATLGCEVAANARGWLWLELRHGAIQGASPLVAAGSRVAAAMRRTHPGSEVVATARRLITLRQRD